MTHLNVTYVDLIDLGADHVSGRLDDNDAAVNLPAGTAGTAAIYTQSAGMTHIIRKVMIRMDSLLNYVVPWL